MLLRNRLKFLFDLSKIIKAFPLFSSFLSCFFSYAVTLLKITFMLSIVKKKLN